MQQTEDMRVCVSGVFLVGQGPVTKVFQDEAQLFIIV